MTGGVTMMMITAFTSVMVAVVEEEDVVVLGRRAMTGKANWTEEIGTETDSAG